MCCKRKKPSDFYFLDENADMPVINIHFQVLFNLPSSAVELGAAEFFMYPCKQGNFSSSFLVVFKLVSFKLI